MLKVYRRSFPVSGRDYKRASQTALQLNFASEEDDSSRVPVSEQAAKPAELSAGRILEEIELS
jgi:hypothetical protein